MFEIQRDRTIHASPQVVWDDIADPDRFADWYAFCDTVAEPSPDRRVLIGSWGAHRSQVTVEVTDRQEPTRFAWRHLEEMLNDRPSRTLSSDVVTIIDLLPDGDDTRVTITTQMTAANIFGSAMNRMMGKRQVGNMLEQSLTLLAGRHVPAKGQ